MIAFRRALLGELLLSVALPVAAQTIPLGNDSLPATTPRTAPTPLPTAVPTAVPAPLLPLPTIAPTSNPAPVVTPTPRASPLPESTPTSAVTPGSATAPRGAPTPASAPTPTPEAVASPTDLPAPTTGTPAIQPSSPVATRTEGGWPWWGIAALLIGAAIVAGAVALLRRRREPEVADEPFAGEPAAHTVPSPRATDSEAAALPAARLVLALRPTRAGLNLLSATVEADLTVTNDGNVDATDIRIAATLISATRAQDADLAAVYAQPMVRPVAPPFTLIPGESRTIRIVTALARDAIQPLIAAGRPMVVPVVAVNCRYANGAGEAQSVHAFAVGVERVNSAKLAPFWLDGPSRMYDQVAARPHGAPLHR